MPAPSPVSGSQPAVGEVDQDLKALADNLMALFAANVRDQSHAAGIVLIPWMIEPLWLRNALTIRSIHGQPFPVTFCLQIARFVLKDTTAARFQLSEIA
jgi:hypothetical protein